MAIKGYKTTKWNLLNQHHNTKNNCEQFYQLANFITQIL